MSILTFTHGIVSHSTTTGIPGDTPNFLVVNGDKVDLHAPLDQSFVTVLAHRDTNYLITLQSGSDIQSWGYGAATGKNFAFDNLSGGGANTNEYYLWIDVNRATGAFTYGHTIREPAVGSTPPFTPSTRPDDVHWFDTSNNTLKVWVASGVGPQYGKWVEYVRIVIAKYIYGSGFTSVSVNSPSFIGTTVGLVGQYRAGALIYDTTGNPVKRTNSTNVTQFFTTDDVFTSGLPSLASPVAGNRARYETFLVDAIGLAPAPAYSMVRFTDFNEVLLLNALSQPDDLFGMIEAPIGASGDLVQVTMSGVVNNPSWTWSTVGQQIFVDKNNDGLLTTVEDDNYVPLADQLPVAVALTRTSVLLRVPELTLTTGSGATVTSHGSLSGLAADDHIIYLPTNGSRGMGGNLNMGTNAIVSVGNVDGRDVSTDGSTLDAHVADTSIHFTQGSPIGSNIPHGNLLDIGSNSHLQIDSHISDTSIHFTQQDLGSPIGSVFDHTVFQNIGTNTHAQIDTHIADGGIHSPAPNLGSPIGSALDHDVLMNVGSNTHSDIDTHISNTSIHTALTVADVNGSPTTSVGDVNTILFNNSSGFDVVDQTGGVVRVDFNSAFNPIIVQGGSPEQTLTASGEEPLKLIAGANVTLTGNAGATPKTITIAATGGGGGGSPVFIPSLIQDADMDTRIRTEASLDEDVIRFDTGISPVGFLARTDILVISSAEFTVEMGSGGTGSPTGAAPINLTSGVGISGGISGGDINVTSGASGTGNARGGDINITTGDGSATFGIFDENNRGGNINLTAGDSSNTHAFGGDITLTAGKGGTVGLTDGGWITIKGGRVESGGAASNQGNIILEGAGISGQIPGPVVIQNASGATSQTTELRFYDLTTQLDPTNKTSTPSGGWVGFQAPNAVPGATVWTLPSADGGTGQVLTTDGGLGLYWSTSSGGVGTGTIRVEEEGTPIAAGSPLPTYHTLNFIGDSITATNAGGSVANITVTDSTGVIVAEEGSDIGGSPSPLFTRLDFLGSAITVTDGGSGTATITVTSNDGSGIDGIAIAEEGTDIGGSPSVFTRLNFIGDNVTTTDAGSGSANINVTNQTIPYDLASPVYGTLGTVVPTRLLHFVAVRAFRILGTTNVHQAYAETGPTGSNATVTIYHDDLTGSPSSNAIATVTFTTGGGDNQVVAFSTTASPNDVDVAIGDVIKIDLTTADSNDILSDIVVTLAAVQI